MHDPANIDQRLIAARELISGRRRLLFRVRSISAPSADQQ
jgi:hypothetical protein